VNFQKGLKGVVHFLINIFKSELMSKWNSHLDIKNKTGLIWIWKVRLITPWQAICSD